MKLTPTETIEKGKAVLGLEFGSTRIKAVLTDSGHAVIAQGSHSWENRYENGYWTYSNDDIIQGLQKCYASLKADVQKKYGVTLKNIAAIGISAMMHGYIALDKNDEMLVPFRTWRNTTTGPAAEELSNLFGVNIPQRWSVAHLYQAILNKETHVPDIAFLTTLSGYVHYLLTGKKVLGIGDASGMFPIDSAAGNYDARMFGQFAELISIKQYAWSIYDLMPKVLRAGEHAGSLTQAGAKLLDPEGDLLPGIPFAPPEGDAGTGMVATNSVCPGTGNVSAGTSIFGMLVLEQELSRAYKIIDMVTTPSGAPVAMVHCNNCTSEVNAWVSLFTEFGRRMGVEIDEGEVYHTLFSAALDGDADCGGLLSYNLLSGEPVLDSGGGRPMFIRTINSRMDLPNFMRAQLYSCLAALKTGFDVLRAEGVKPKQITGHGGYFKQEGIGQNFLAAALDTPVTVMETAAEGGAWGMSILARYLVEGKGKDLADYLDHAVFRNCKSATVEPDENDVKGFEVYLERFLGGLETETTAERTIPDVE